MKDVFLLKPLCFLAILFCVVSISLKAQWHTACGASNYCDVGLITPAISMQTVPNSVYCFKGRGSNTFTPGREEFVKCHFVVGAAGTNYCFLLSTQSSDTLGGNEIDLLTYDCGGSGSVVFIHDEKGKSQNMTNNWASWTAGAADTGKTYFIQLSDGNTGGTFFGTSGSEIVKFSYKIGGCPALADHNKWK